VTVSCRKTCCKQRFLQGAQLRSTTRHFAQCYSILAHFQHSKFYTVYIQYISRSPFNAWNASLFACLHGCAVACASCATKQTFVQCRIFLEGTLVTKPFVLLKDTLFFLEIDRYIGLADISADIWALPIYRYRPKRPILSASIGVDKRCYIPHASRQLARVSILQQRYQVRFHKHRQD